MPLGTSCSHKEELFCCAESNGPEKEEKKSKDDSKFVNITFRSGTISLELKGAVSRNTANTKGNTDGQT